MPGRVRREAAPLPAPFPPPPFPSCPQFVLLVYNISKASNIGPLVRTAVAFSCSAVAVVGARKLSTHGNQLTARFLPFVHYSDIRTAVQHIRGQGYELVGVEIEQGAEEVSAAAFGQRVCFVAGNEGTGLNELVRGLLDRCVYVRQSGVGTASLNVAMAMGIVLYRFQHVAGYPEAKREGGKFIVDDSRAVGQRGFRAPRGEKRKASEQQQQQQQHQQRQQHQQGPGSAQPPPAVVAAAAAGEEGTAATAYASDAASATSSASAVMWSVDVHIETG